MLGENGHPETPEWSLPPREPVHVELTMPLLWHGDQA